MKGDDSVATKIYTCRFCKQPIIAEEDEEGKTWITRSKNYYYHIDCWEKYINDRQSERRDEDWFDLVVDLITRELKKEYEYFKIKAQFDKFIKEKMTGKGIYYTFYYIFLVLKKEYKEEFGIGLIPFMYDQSIKYWAEEEKKKKGIMDQIRKIQEARMAITVIKKSRANGKKKSVEVPDFDDLDDLM